MIIEVLFPTAAKEQGEEEKGKQRRDISETTERGKAEKGHQ